MAPCPLHKITAIVNTQDHLSLRLSAERRAGVFGRVWHGVCDARRDGAGGALERRRSRPQER